MSVADRPTSITGGARYDSEPVPGQRPVTVRYFVAWRTADGDIRYVTSLTRWRGHDAYVHDVDADHRFRDRVEVDMRKWPPI